MMFDTGIEEVRIAFPTTTKTSENGTVRCYRYSTAVYRVPAGKPRTPYHHGVDDEDADNKKRRRRHRIYKTNQQA